MSDRRIPRSRTGWFDRFAEATSRVASRAWFFATCVLLVVLWAPSYWVIGDVDTYQLVINTITTIVTFLLVALLQNAQRRAEDVMIRQNREILDRLAALETAARAPERLSPSGEAPDCA